MFEEFFGRLPKRTGWQPVLPGDRTRFLLSACTNAQRRKIPCVTKFDLRRQDCITGMSRLANDSVELVVTSPPYNLGVSYSQYSGPSGPENIFGLVS